MPKRRSSISGRTGASSRSSRSRPFRAAGFSRFEPLPGPATRFRAVLGGYPNVTLFEQAVGPEVGEAVIHFRRGRIFPRCCRLGGGWRSCSRERRRWAKRGIRVAPTGKALGAEDIVRPAMLKLDVQGYELEALKVSLQSFLTVSAAQRIRRRITSRISACTVASPSAIALRCRWEAPALPTTPVIAIANQKGGVGKTTSTVCLALALTQLGQRVLAVDCDPQASLTLYFGADPRALEAEGRTVYSLMLEDRPRGGSDCRRQAGPHRVEHPARFRRERACRSVEWRDTSAGALGSTSGHV